MSDSLLDKGRADRSKIAVTHKHEVRYWTKHLGVSFEALQKAIYKVGNSAATVKRELGK